MSRLNVNLHEDFQPAPRFPRRSFLALNREPLSSELSFLLSVVACLAGLFLVYVLFFR
ncbi:MAG: hypothetical protein QOH65_3025 [Methylobacteriaceae bacterium]|jgi:hypothetical protein|nr:hypothetical protein [Methylobacteriaceae bacterium]